MKRKSLGEFFFSFRGRISRDEYWTRAFPILFPYGIMVTIISYAESESSRFPTVSFILSLISLWPGLAVIIKRLHDRNRSGWFLLTLFIPFLNIAFGVWIIIEVLFLKGIEGENRFGPDPIQAEKEPVQKTPALAPEEIEPASSKKPQIQASDSGEILSEEASLSRTETLLTSNKELTVGSMFADRYQIIEELGKGGMGKVYKAIDKEVEEKVALKLIRPEIAAEEKRITRFRNELKTARKISHKNVCRMFDLGRVGDTYYITMEYVSGEDLKSTMRRVGSLSTGKAILIAKQVCYGLAEAHRQGIIHRDLKPQNIMIDRNGNALIMDFGIALSGEAKGLTEDGTVIGTPEYMSPEQVEGKKVDRRSDVYSMGVILYEMVTGRIPFDGKTPMSVASKHLTERPREPRELNAQVPERLSRVILKSMQKEKERRYQSVEEMLLDLEEIEREVSPTDRIVTERKPITSREITVTFKLRKLLIPVSVVVGVAVVGILVWQFILVPKTKEKFSSSIPPKEETLVAAQKHMKDRNYSEALNQFKEVLATEPENFEAQLSIATILKEQGEIDKAIEEFEKAIDLNSTDPRSYKELAEIFKGKKEHEKELHYYKKYLSTAPKSSDFNEINKKITELETQFLLTERQKTSAVQPEGTEVAQKEVDILGKIDLGIAAYNQGQYDQCIKQMEEVLRIESGNESARHYLVEATKRKEEIIVKQKIRNRINLAQSAYQKGAYQECLNQSKEVLKLDPENAEARKYLDLSSMKIAPKQIHDLVNQYIHCVNSNTLLSFYQDRCSSNLFQRIKKDVELINHLYDDFKSVASDITLRFGEINQVEVHFSNITTGVLKQDGRRLVIFEGVYTWNLEKQNDSWKIVRISARVEKKQ